MGANNRKKRTKKNSKSKNKKKKLAQTRAGGSDVILMGATKQDNSTGNEITMKNKSFSKVEDPATGKHYFHNADTGEVVWTLPAGAELIGEQKDVEKESEITITMKSTKKKS